MPLNILSRSILALLVALFISACGGGGGSGGGTTTPAPTTITGRFVDATVVGISYKCGTSTTVSGTTNANGEFTCPTGQAVAFYVGDILVGSVPTATSLVTPLDLVGAGATPTNTTVANIVRFLMSISSSDPATGTITITPAVIAAAAGKTVDFTAVSGTAMDTLIPTLKSGATIYTAAQATAHVTSSINGLFAGNYAGTYSGAMSGTWSVTIAANGTVTGTADGSSAISGTMATTLSTGSTYGFTGTAGGTPWVGTLNISTKVFSGTWNDGAGSSGTWTGTTNTGGGSTTPTITNFTPTTGSVSTSMAITGTNLSSVTDVLFTGPSPSTAFVSGVIGTKTATSITTTVPASLTAGSYTVSVVHPGGEVAAAGTFTVTVSVPATPVGTQMGGSRQGIAVSLTVGTAPAPFNSISYYSGATAFAGSSTNSTDGIGLLASFNNPRFITTDGINLYVAESASIRKIDIASGAVVTFASISGSANGITTDGTNLYVAAPGWGIQQVNIATGVVSDIPLIQYSLTNPTGVNLNCGYKGMTIVATNLYCISGANTGDGIQIVDISNTATRGTVSNLDITDTTTMIGSTVFVDGLGKKKLRELVDLTTDGTNLYLTRGGSGSANPAIDKIVISTGVVSTIAGGAPAGIVDNNVGTSASFTRPYGITTDGTSLFVTDRVTGGGIRKINIQTTAVTGGNVGFGDQTNLGGPNLPTFNSPRALTTDGKNLYAVDSSYAVDSNSGFANVSKIIKLQ